MKKIIKIATLCLAFLTIIVISWIYYSIAPSSTNSDLTFADGLASSYHRMHLNQFNCTRIEYGQDQTVVILFELKTRPWRRFSLFEYSCDECIDDIVKIRDETSLFLNNNLENELNGKKIHLIFKTYADESMHLYNYNFQDNSEFDEKGSFCYYNNLEIHNIEKLKKFCNAKILIFSTDLHYEVSDMSVFNNYNSLEILKCPKFFSNDAIDYLKNKFPNCNVAQ